MATTGLKVSKRLEDFISFYDEATDTRAIDRVHTEDVFPNM